MLDFTLSRRAFVGCAGGALALAAAGGVALGSTTKNGHPVYPTRDELDTWSANGLCSACPNLCSYAAYVNDSKVGKLIANGAHPNAPAVMPPARRPTPPIALPSPNAVTLPATLRP